MFSRHIPTLHRHAVRTLATASAETSMIKRKPTPILKPVYVQLSSLVHESPEEAQTIAANYAVLDPTVFAHPIRRDILHLCVVHHLDGLRQGSASTKDRSEVNYANRKIRPQKGTGMARLGERGSPMLVGGGRAHGPKPRDFTTKLPKKVRDMGMRVALSLKIRDRRLGVVPSLEWPGHKTKYLSSRLSELGWTASTLFVTGHTSYLTKESTTANLALASRNLQKIDVIHAEELLLFDLLKWQRVILDTEAVNWFERRYKKKWVEFVDDGHRTTRHKVDLKQLLPQQDDYLTLEDLVEDVGAPGEMFALVESDAKKAIEAQAVALDWASEAERDFEIAENSSQVGILTGGRIRRPARYTLHARL